MLASSSMASTPSFYRIYTQSYRNRLSVRLENFISPNANDLWCSLHPYVCVCAVSSRRLVHIICQFILQNLIFWHGISRTILSFDTFCFCSCVPMTCITHRLWAADISYDPDETVDGQNQYVDRIIDDSLTKCNLKSIDWSWELASLSHSCLRWHLRADI